MVRLSVFWRGLLFASIAACAAPSWAQNASSLPPPPPNDIATPPVSADATAPAPLTLSEDVQLSDERPDADPSIPPAIRTMLRAAIDGGKEEEIVAIARLAKIALPNSEAEIDALLVPHKRTVAEERAQAARKAQEAARAAEILAQRWIGRGEIGGFRSTGTSNEIGLGASIRFSKTTKTWTHLIRASVDYRRTNGATSRENWLAAYEPRYTFSQRGYAYALAQYEHDPFLGYDSRYSGSAGLGYKLLTGPKLTAGFDAGPSLRVRDQVDGTQTTEAGVRASFDVGWKITPQLSLTQDTDGYVQNTGQSLTSLTALDARVLARLSTRFSYQVQYESATPLNVRRLDTLSKVSVIYDF